MTALEDGYVECVECGHALEGHRSSGCLVDRCPCTEGWRQFEIRSARREAGLPADYRPEDFS